MRRKLKEAVKEHFIGKTILSVRDLKKQLVFVVESGHKVERVLRGYGFCIFPESRMCRNQ